MKKSAYSTQLSCIGLNGKITGSLIATMNYDSETIETVNFLHDDIMRTKYLHKVEAFVGTALWDSVTKLTTEDSLLNQSSLLKIKLIKHLETLANEKPIESFNDKMKKIFV